MKTVSFDLYLKKRLSKDEIEEIEKAALIESQIQLDIQKQIAMVVNSYMENSNFGFNDMVRLLGTSPSQFKKIKDGKANLTLATIAHIFSLIKKRPVIYSEELN
jgi:hypothetical protein